MICRLWRGWTTQGNADAYEKAVRGEVIPAIEARRIPGFRHIDLMRRELEAEVEFATLMWFDSIEAITAFVGKIVKPATFRRPPAHCCPASTNARPISSCLTAAHSRAEAELRRKVRFMPAPAC